MLVDFQLAEIVTSEVRDARAVLVPASCIYPSGIPFLMRKSGRQIRPPARFDDDATQDSLQRCSRAQVRDSRQFIGRTKKSVETKRYALTGLVFCMAASNVSEIGGRAIPTLTDLQGGTKQTAAAGSSLSFERDVDGNLQRQVFSQCRMC